MSKNSIFYLKEKNPTILKSVEKITDLTNVKCGLSQKYKFLTDKLRICQVGTSCKQNNHDAKLGGKICGRENERAQQAVPDNCGRWNLRSDQIFCVSAKRTRNRRHDARRAKVVLAAGIWKYEKYEGCHGDRPEGHGVVGGGSL